jgi:hypothetical protein
LSTSAATLCITSALTSPLLACAISTSYEALTMLICFFSAGAVIVPV